MAPKLAGVSNAIILSKVQPGVRSSNFVRSSRKSPRPLFLTVSYSLGLGAALSSSSSLRQLTLHFNILLDGELGEGLLDAQGRESGGSVRVPALSHDFADDPQSLR